jgi:hypothetical protein
MGLPIREVFDHHPLGLVQLRTKGCNTPSIDVLASRGGSEWVKVRKGERGARVAQEPAALGGIEHAWCSAREHTGYAGSRICVEGTVVEALVKPTAVNLAGHGRTGVEDGFRWCGRASGGDESRGERRATLGLQPKAFRSRVGMFKLI